MAGRRYHTIRRFIFQKCNESNITSRRQAGDTLWNQDRTDVIAHSNVRGFQDKFNTPRDGQYRALHTAPYSLIIDVLNKAANSRRNARHNSDAEEEGEGEGGELGKAACRYVEEGEHPRQFIGILQDIQGLNVTPDAADQIELIDDNQVDAWLFVPPGGGDPVHPNIPLVGHCRNYLAPGQFDVAEFYSKPESDSDEEDNIGYPAKGRRAFPRSHDGWQKRILSNDRKIIWPRPGPLCGPVRGILPGARVFQGPAGPVTKPRPAYMSRYAEQDVPHMALPPGIPPPRCEVSVDDAVEESDDDNNSDDETDGANGGNA
ncbi:hypothetical protein HOY82DRAFT_616506 [Tuber indicum]|nr:hypothetical protein HOY82DRAFT_616506 [Tuber indicum]